MPKTAHLNARLERRLKTDAERVLARLGLKATDAVTMFYRQVVLRRGLPFDVCLPNAETLAAFEEDAGGAGRVFRGSTKDAVDTILRG